MSYYTFSFREGDVAYLRNAEGYSSADWQKLQESQHTITRAAWSMKQTNHPCVVLRRLPNDRLVVATVSSHGGGGKAPWNRADGHRSKRDDFRAFVGSESPSTKRPDLRLQPGQQWPMPKASWTNVRKVLEVPASVLGAFKKSQYPLRMDPDSLDDLRCHVAQTGAYNDRLQAWGFGKQQAAVQRPSLNTSWRPSSTASSTSSTTATPPSSEVRKPEPARAPPQVPARISSLPSAPAKSALTSWASVAAALPEVRRPMVEAH